MIKKTIMTLCAAIIAVFMVGCDKLPTVEKMTAISTVIGKTAGYACELAKTKKEVKDAIFVVLDVVSKVVPNEGQTFTEAWTPVITEELNKLVKAGKINENEASIAKIALTAATEGLDYVFLKYPKAKDVKELVAAATSGFITGYKSVVTVGASANVDVDADAYRYITERLAAKK